MVLFGYRISTELARISHVKVTNNWKEQKFSLIKVLVCSMVTGDWYVFLEKLIC